MKKKFQHEAVGIDLRVTAEVFQKVWSNNPMRPGKPSFFVRLKVVNRGENMAVFDTVAGSFLNRKNKGLHVKTTSGKGEIQIPGGEECAYDFETNGYTEDLLRDSRFAGPLRFDVVIRRGGSPVGGPWSAELPALETLPVFFDEMNPFDQCMTLNAMFPGDPMAVVGAFGAFGAFGVVEGKAQGVVLTMRRTQMVTPQSDPSLN